MSNQNPYKNFKEFFVKATGCSPYPYQQNLAESPIPSIINVPTGAGKTEAAILGMWLWHRLQDNASTPRRLIYCLPRRVLVEQTESRVKKWMEKLGLDKRIGVALLMGGSNDWDLEKHPAKEYIIIGTQDMLVSGALNRGYGSSPYGWPIVFGLYNNDCMWVMDEIQIMENALPTSIQLDAFRGSFGTFGPHHTVWMSATINQKWLHTADSSLQDHKVYGLTKQDTGHGLLKERNNAPKTLCKAKIKMAKKYLQSDAEYLHSLHQKGTVTAIMVNTVKRAQELYGFLKKNGAECRLIHSRFRAADREELNRWIGRLAEKEDMIIIATQVLEAGVDLSVRTLITEIAPWSNMVQRFGRCNRKGTLGKADIYWIDIPNEENHRPYDSDDMEYSRDKLSEFTGRSVSPGSLPSYNESRVFDAVLRRRDIVDLFDTSSDLSGNYIDASRFVRTIKRQMDVDVFWRNNDLSRPIRDEICSVSISALKEFLKKSKSGSRVWDYNDGVWAHVRAGDLFPGQTVMLESSKGGYSKSLGWDVECKDDVEIIPNNQNKPNDSYNGDAQSQSNHPVTLEDHTAHVLHEVCEILQGLPFLDKNIKDAVVTAVIYHDTGKTHHVFQDTMSRGMIDPASTGSVWAKSQKGGIRHKISGFRHEVASALAYLKNTDQQNPHRDLVAYLIAAHHGKVRLSLRSVSRKKQDSRYLLGIKIDGDHLPEFSSSVVSIGKTDINMSTAQIGRSKSSIHSWTERMLALRDMHGPFRLAYMELLVRAADGLASKKETEGAYTP